MTTPSTQRKAGPLLGTGVQTAWPFTFKIFAEGDIKVTTVDTLGTETELVLNTDYGVSVNANQDTSPGGTVTYPLSGSPLAVGSKLTITGDLEYDQPLDLPAGGNFSPAALENELDRIVMQVQQLREQLTRALLAPVTSSASGTLPQPQANTIIGWDVTESALQNVPIADLATAATYGSWTNDTFTGNGVQTTFVLSDNPVVLSNLTVTVDGLTLVPGTDFGLTAGSLIFTSAPSNGAEILARYGEALTVTGSAAIDTSFTPTGSIAATNVQAALAELDSEKQPAGTYLTPAAVGVSVQAYDAATAKTNVIQSFSKPQRATITAANTGAFDCSLTNNFSCTPTGGVTLTPSNLAAGQSGYILLVNGSNYAIAKAASVKCSTSLLATLSATGTYVVSYFSDGTSMYITGSSALA